MTLVAELQAVFDEVGACFEANDFGRLSSLWDADDPSPFYMAEEHETLVACWPELDAYWAVTRDINTGCTARWTVANAKPLGETHAAAQFTLDWKIHVKGQPEPYGGFCRGLAVLRRAPGGWRFTAYAEAPLAPLTYLRKLYVRVGRDL
jgi:hypothetical protein